MKMFCLQFHLCLNISTGLHIAWMTLWTTVHTPNISPEYNFILKKQWHDQRVFNGNLHFTNTGITFKIIRSVFIKFYNRWFIAVFFYCIIYT